MSHIHTGNATLTEVLPPLQQALAVASVKFDRAREAKSRYAAGLLGHTVITIENRHDYLQLLKAEQDAYRDCHKVEVEILNVLRSVMFQ
jgi:hypothetical protein